MGGKGGGGYNRGVKGTFENFMTKESTTLDKELQDFILARAYLAHSFNSGKNGSDDSIITKLGDELEGKISLAIGQKLLAQLKLMNNVIIPKIKKFIDKVESGRARSKETYADMLAIRTFLNEEKRKLESV